MTLRTLLNWHKNQELISKNLRLSWDFLTYILIYKCFMFLTESQPISQSMKLGRFIWVPRIAGLSIRRTLSVWELKLVTLAAVASLWASAENKGPDTYPEITCNREMSCKFILGGVLYMFSFPPISPSFFYKNTKTPKDKGFFFGFRKNRNRKSTFYGYKMYGLVGFDQKNKKS